MEYQRTIGKEVSYSGIALHTGNDATITFLPAPPNSGIQFERIDLAGHPRIKAHVSKIADVVRGSNIQEGKAKIYTVEHLLASFLGLRVDNVLVRLDANEPPVGDGSASHFVEMIKEAGVVTQDAPRRYCHLRQSFWVSENGSMLVALPHDGLKVTCTIDFNHPEVSSQHITLSINEKTFEEEIAVTRTFCFQHEVKELMEKGLIKGGSLDNAVVIGDDAVYSKETLRFKNEFVRHKILDLLGDISLLGKPIKAHFIAVKPGHNLNIKLTEQLYKSISKSQEEQMSTVANDNQLSSPQIDINQIMKYLPHRYPFLLIDKVTEMNDTTAAGVKNVTINEHFFQGHFPDRPIMPGVLIVESMAQLGGIMLLKKSENVGKYAYFMSMDNVKFRKIVLPGDQLVMKVELVKARSKTGKVHAQAYVDNSLVAEADLMFAIVDG